MIRKIISSIPNTITCANLFCGCCATVFAFNGAFDITFWFIIAAVIFDFLDGFAARALKAYSNMGKELDSLADLISFGMAPAAVFFTIGLEYFAFIIVIFSALRLAKFNVDTRQTTEFIGLATPANALFFVSLGYMYMDKTMFFNGLLDNLYVSGSLVVVFSLLLVSEIRMFSLKLKSYKIKDNIVIYSFLLCSATSIAMFGIVAIPFIVITYIIINIVNHLYSVRIVK